MPNIASAYPGPPFYLFNGHLETIYPAKTALHYPVPYQRERLQLSDGDFLDLDWVLKHQSKLVILSHGLEGNSQRSYILSTAQFFMEKGWDVLAWNCRSCSEEINRTPKIYYHGDTEDIREVIRHAHQKMQYEQIVLIGFSMGGSINLKYLGVHKDIPETVKASVSFSVPCDLGSSAAALNKKANFLYRNKFKKALFKKMQAKAAQFPDHFDMEKWALIKKWEDFDEYFSAPINGFSSAEELYYHGSANNFLSGIKVPSLLVNAQNDPILMEASFPYEKAEKHPFFYLESPKRGGHVGFSWPKKQSFSWREARCLSFLEEHLKISSE